MKLQEHIDLLRKFYIPNKRLLLMLTRDIFAKHLNTEGKLQDPDGLHPMTTDEFITAVMRKTP